MILITGASGNVGKEVLKQIAQSGVRVRAAFQSATKGSSAPSGVEIAVADYNRPETLREALRAVDRVFLVGPPTAQLPELERKAIDVIKQLGVGQVVKLSAMGGRDVIFPRQHAESEDRIKGSGVPWTFLRPNGFMQNMVIYCDLQCPDYKHTERFLWQRRRRASQPDRYSGCGGGCGESSHRRWPCGQGL